jgi:hypothetical protein
LPFVHVARRLCGLVKIDKKTLTMVVDEELEGTLEEIGEGEFIFPRWVLSIIGQWIER